MKTYLWLSTAAFGLICFTLWELSSMFFQLIRSHSGQLPAVTEIGMRINSIVLFLPIVCAIYSFVLSNRRELTLNAMFTFTGSLILATGLLLFVFGIGFALPWFGITLGGEHL
jgi:hypothetical protein